MSHWYYRHDVTTWYHSWLGLDFSLDRTWHQLASAYFPWQLIEYCVHTMLYWGHCCGDTACKWVRECTREDLRICQKESSQIPCFVLSNFMRKNALMLRKSTVQLCHFVGIFLSQNKFVSYQDWMSPHCFLCETSRPASKFGRCCFGCFLKCSCAFFRTQWCHVHPYLL